MKIGRQGSWGILRLGQMMVVVVAMATVLACGRSASDEEETPQLPAKSPLNGGEDLLTKSLGFAAFGSQCSSGFRTDPKKVQLELWSCPTKLPVVELAETLQPLYLSADCARKTLTIRSADMSINDTWELMPDASFYITQERLTAKLVDDGSGNAGCVTPLQADIWGRVDCPTDAAQRDKAKIHFETVMWLNKKADTTPKPKGTACDVPEGKCYFHTITSVAQCQ